MTSAMMLAITTSACSSTTSNRSPQRISMVSSKPLIFTFSLATRTATASRSVASTRFAPMWAAAMASIPVPVPMSMAVSPGFTYFSTSLTHMPVVSWVPVPKAMPGSISITWSPGAVSTVSQLGLISMCAPRRKGLNAFFQLSVQSSSATE